MLNKEIKEGNKSMTKQQETIRIDQISFKMIQMELTEMKTIIIRIINLIDKCETEDYTKMKR